MSNHSKSVQTWLVRHLLSNRPHRYGTSDEFIEMWGDSEYRTELSDIELDLSNCWIISPHLQEHSHEAEAEKYL